ncbi:MAG: tetratricopeptide repeat protein [Methanoregula sp.]
MNPDFSLAWYHKGLILSQLKRFEEALSAYDEAIRLDPDYAPVWSDKGFTLRQLNRFEEALSAYDAASKRYHSQTSMK